MGHTGKIFALDIGTRSVVGIIGRLTGQGFEVIDVEILEHRTRSMLDGQIHDVHKVTQVVQTVKDRLEERQGMTFYEAAVAAAGRALRTVRGQAGIETSSVEEINRQQIIEMELAAVQNAQAVLAEDQESQLYQCVGYNTVAYHLDGVPMSNLQHHRGSQIAAEVIATFLPCSVVDSLYAVLKNCGLSMKTLTLEPIAALNVIIPANLRSLNLALVDIGAGTSDIALVAQGSVQNYAMVPIAGDEITECLCTKYLLDFNEAEQLKRSLAAPGKVKFKDVLGTVQEKATKEIVRAITPEVKPLAAAIAEKILVLNGQAPAAVMLVGGGSLTPTLPAQLAKQLGLPKHRVAVRGLEAVNQVAGNLAKLHGPECITPIGIAITSVNDKALNLLQVEVNGCPVRLFCSKQGTVADALLASGVNQRKMRGRPGMAISVTVNGNLVIFKGELGTPAIIRCNGKGVDVDAPLQPNDYLEVVLAQDGKPGNGTVQEAIRNLPIFTVQVNGNSFRVVPPISMNGSLVSPETVLVDRAEIVWEPIRSVGDLLACLALDPPGSGEITVQLNGYKRSLRYTVGALMLNGKHAEISTPVHAGDKLELVDGIYPCWRVRDIVPSSEPVFIDIELNGQSRSLPSSKNLLKLNGRPVFGDEKLQNGDQIEYSAMPQT